MYKHLKQNILKQDKYEQNNINKYKEIKNDK